MYTDPDDFDILDLHVPEPSAEDIRDEVHVNQALIDSSMSTVDLTYPEGGVLKELGDSSDLRLDDVFHYFENEAANEHLYSDAYKINYLLDQIAARSSHFYSQPEVISQISPLECEVGVHLSDHLRGVIFNPLNDLSQPHFQGLKESINDCNNSYQVMTQKIVASVPQELALHPDRSLNQIIEEQVKKLLTSTLNEDFSNAILKNITSSK